MTLKHVKREEEHQSYGSTAQDVLIGLRNLIDLSLHATTIIAAFAKGKHPLSNPPYVQCPSAFIPYFNPLLIRHWKRNFEALLCSVADPP